MNRLLVNSIRVVSEWGKRLGERQRMEWIIGFHSWLSERSCHGCNFRPPITGRIPVILKTISGRRRILEAETSMVSMGFCVRFGINYVQSLNSTPRNTCHDAAVNAEKSTGSWNLPDWRRFASGFVLAGQSKDGKEIASRRARLQKLGNLVAKMNHRLGSCFHTRIGDRSICPINILGAQ